MLEKLNDSKTESTSTNSTKIELKFGKKFITKSLRGQNYDLETALSELLDNSIDADARNIEIIYPSKLQRKKSELITIKDDGLGMSQEQLINAMTLGSDRDYDDSEIGYFGIGMKASLAYLSENVIIKTKRKSDNFSTILKWDIDVDTSFTITQEYNDSEENGTTITINPGWRYDHYSHTQESPVIKKMGGRYYHLLYVNESEIDNYKKQVKIKFNDTIIEPSDPMYRGNEKTLSSGCEDIIWIDNFDNEYPIKLTGYYLKDNQYDLNYFDIKAGRSGKLSTERSGVYVLLNNKYINLGGTFLGVTKLDPHLNYLRIELSIPKGSTEYFGISMNKNSISEIFGDDRHTDSIKEKIRRGVNELTSWGRKQEEIFKRKQSSVDIEEVNQTEKISNQLNNDFKSKGITKSPLMDPEISKKVPASKSTNIDKEPKGTKNRPTNLHYDKNLLDINIYNGGEIGDFWDITRKNTKLVLRLNSDHIFYKEFILTSSESEKKKMFKLLFSLAWAQLETLNIYDFDGQINDLWNDFWAGTSKALKRTLS
jgi:anti-sigma regulatory factor (Ser/Thr protein kinase)